MKGESWGSRHAPDGAQVYLWTGKGRFKVMDRKEVERQAVAVRMTALGEAGGAKSGGGPVAANGAASGLGQAQDAGTVSDLENGARAELLRLEAVFVLV